jgi:signal transduction histidine kinase
MSPIDLPHDARRLASTLRLKVTLSVFTLVLLGALSGVIFFMVQRIFDRLTPSLRADLQWKAQHGAAELVHRAELGIVLADREMIRDELADLLSSEDIVAVVVVDPHGAPIAVFGDPPESIARLFSGAPGGVRHESDYLVSWTHGTIEGEHVGRLAIVVSTSRLAAGARLRAEILGVGVAACLAALLLSLLFVHFYVGPLIKTNERAMKDLRHLAATLEARVGERTAELSRANDDLQATLERLRVMQGQLVDASRKAGMAVVATTVLHNAGNVMNSVNVSATLIGDRLRKSRVGSLARVLPMLEEHKGDLAAFLTTDDKGRKIPAFLASTLSAIEAEREEILREVDGLAENVRHIRVVITMQQTNARMSGGLREVVSLREIMDDAIKLQASSCDRHEIQVVREYEDIPPITVDRHKLFQVLTNLTSNARHALKDSSLPDKRMSVSLRSAGDGRVAIEVADNGVGIPAENLGRIFEYGFTTKKDGHGFGLHSSALAIQELGGTLKVHSDGAGKGARFVVELPIEQADEGVAA